MSEQFAIQTEDYESTNDRLDSILDRLNALGQSVNDSKAESSRPLVSVPDLVEPAEETADAPAFEPDIYDGLYDDPVLVPVEPVEIEDTADVAVLGGTLPDATLADTVVEEPVVEEPVVDEPVIENTVVEPLPELGSWQRPDLVPPPMPPLGLVPPVPLGSTDVAEINELHTLVESETELETDAFEPELDAQTDGEAFSSLDVVDAGADFESVTPLELVIEDEPTLVDETTEVTGLDAPNVFALHDVPPVPDEVAAVAVPMMDETPVEIPTLDEAPAVAPAIDTPVVDATNEARSLFASEESRADVASQIFGTDTTDEPVDFGAPPVASSIFGSSPTADPAVAETTPVPPAPTDGWVSHHGPSDDLQPPTLEETETIAESTDTFAAVSDTEWPTEAVSTGGLFDQDTAAEPAFGGAGPSEMAAAIEQDLNELGTVRDDPFAQFAAIESPTAIADFEAPPAIDGATYESDEELPLLDFTGVYDETAAQGIPTSVESNVSSGISVARGELDSLRPTDDTEQSEMAIADEKSGAGWSPIFQLILVIGFGVAVLVYFWLQDPAAVEDMRREFNAITGRN